MLITLNQVSDVRDCSISDLKKEPILTLNDQKFKVTLSDSGKFSVSEMNAITSNFFSFIGVNTNANQLTTQINQKLEEPKSMPHPAMMTERFEAKSLDIDEILGMEPNRDEIVLDALKQKHNVHSTPLGTLISTCRPKPQEKDEYANMLKDLGVDVLISVADAVPQEITDALTDQGLIHVNEDALHLEDFSFEATKMEQQLKDITQRIKAYEDQGLKVAIHCGAGDGRSGLVKTAYVLSKSEVKDEFMTEKRVGVETDFSGKKAVTPAIPDVATAIASVRDYGHENAIERPDDVTTLNHFYTLRQFDDLTF